MFTPRAGLDCPHEHAIHDNASPLKKEMTVLTGATAA
jgi:hypothetical protein